MAHETSRYLPFESGMKTKRGGSLVNSSRPEIHTRHGRAREAIRYYQEQIQSQSGSCVEVQNGEWKTRTSEAVPNPQRFSGASSTPTGSTLRNAPERRKFSRERA